MARGYGCADSLVGLRRGDHLCWILDGPAAWRPTATTFLAEGVTQGEQLLYLSAETDVDQMLRDVAGLTHRDDLVASGQLIVMSIDEPGDRPDRPDR